MNRLERRGRARSWRRTTVGIVAALALAGAGLSTLTGTARADITGVHFGPGHVVAAVGSNWHINALKDADGVLWYCPQPDRPTPTSVVGAQTEATAGYTNAQGDVMDATTMHVLAALLWRYGQTDDDDQASAVYLAVRSVLDLTAVAVGPTDWHPSWMLPDPASFGSQLADSIGVRQLALDMIAWARSNYNPGWGGTGELTSSFSPEARVAPDAPWTVTASLPGLGPDRAVVFHVTDPTGATTDSTANTDADGNAVFTTSVPAEPPGRWSVTAALADSVPPQWAVQQPASDVQELVLGGGQPLTWETAQPVSVWGGKFTPSVSTTPQRPVVAIGEQNTDHVEGTCLPGDSVSGTVFLYDGFASEAAALAANVTRLTASGTGTFSGVCADDGTFAIPSTAVTITKPGTAFFYENLDGTDRSVAVAQSKEGRTTELFTVSPPTFDTELSARIMTGAVDLSDTLNVHGLPVGDSGPRVRFTGRIVGPVWPDDTGSCPAAGADAYGRAPVVSTIAAVLDDATIASTGDATLPDQGAVHLVGPAPGCYSAEVQMSVSLDDDDLGSPQSTSVIAIIDSPAGTVSETSVVVQPELGTHIATPDGAFLGGEVSDTVRFTGLVPASGVTYGWHADFGYARRGTNGACDWSTVSIVASDDFTLDPAAIQADGTAVVSGVLPTRFTRTGCAGYAESLDVHYRNEVTIHVDHAFGSPGQSTAVTSPVPSSRITASDGAVLGGRVHDTVTIDGLAVPSGTTVTATWHSRYGDAPIGTDGTCDWAAVTILDQSDTPIAATAIDRTGTVTLDSVLPATITGVGCVGYAGTLTVRDANTVLATVEHPFGADNQWLRVAPPAVSSRMDVPDGPTLGHPASDTVAIAGLVLSPDSTITAIWHAEYGHAPQNPDGSCDWDLVRVDAAHDTVIDPSPDIPDEPAAKASPSSADDMITLDGILPATLNEVGCAGYAGTLVVTDATGTVSTAEHPFGADNQWDIVVALVTPPSGAGANTGGAGSPWTPSLKTLIPALVLMLVVADGLVCVVRSRRRDGIENAA